MHRAGFSITKELTVGTHHIKYEKTDYLPLEFDINVVANTPATYHKTLTPITYDMKLALTDTTLCDAHDIHTGDTFHAKFYVKNNGNVDARATVRVYVNGTQVTSFNTGVIPASSDSANQSVNLTAPTTPGDLTIKVDVAPSGFSVTDSATDTVHVSAREPKFAITRMTLSAAEGKPGDSITVSLRIKNEGTGAGKCDVLGFLNDTALGQDTTDPISVGAEISYDYAFTIPHVDAGSYTLKIEVGRVGISIDDTQSAGFTVNAETALITFASDPAGAKVYVDGVYIGTT